MQSNWREVFDMSLLFGTEEWFGSFIKRLNNDDRYRVLAADYEGALVFRCYAEPKVHPILAEDRIFYFEPHHGRIRQWRVLEPGDSPDVKYQLEGSYAAWKEVATGKVDIKKAVLMTQQIRVKGKISELVNNIAAAERIIEVLKETEDETLFPDDATAE